MRELLCGVQGGQGVKRVKRVKRVQGVKEVKEVHGERCRGLRTNNLVFYFYITHLPQTAHRNPGLIFQLSVIIAIDGFRNIGEQIEIVI